VVSAVIGLSGSVANMPRRKYHEAETFEVDEARAANAPGRTFEVAERERTSGKYKARTVSQTQAPSGGKYGLERPKTVLEQVRSGMVKAGVAAGKWVAHGGGKGGKYAATHSISYQSSDPQRSAPTRKPRKSPAAKPKPRKKRARPSPAGTVPSFFSSPPRGW
jgi:hypothetical protein